MSGDKPSHAGPNHRHALAARAPPRPRTARARRRERMRGAPAARAGTKARGPPEEAPRAPLPRRAPLSMALVAPVGSGPCRAVKPLKFVAGGGAWVGGGRGQTGEAEALEARGVGLGSPHVRRRHVHGPERRAQPERRRARAAKHQVSHREAPTLLALPSPVAPRVRPGGAVGDGARCARSGGLEPFTLGSARLGALVDQLLKYLKG